MPIDTVEKNEMLKSEIQKYIVLWNKKHKKYKDRYVTVKAWVEVAKCTGITGKQNLTFQSLFYCYYSIFLNK